jgi:FkbM family methyltransferase
MGARRLLADLFRRAMTRVTDELANRRDNHDGVVRQRGTVISTTIRSKQVRFFVANGADTIQAVHASGRFWEQPELDIIERHFRGGVFVDVGSNVGNHAIYAALFLGAARVIAFEPNPLAARILDINLALNQLAGSVTVHHSGLADRSGRASIWISADNLGRARLTSDATGDRELVRGDDVLSGTDVSFIKIDAEGMELGILDGLQRTIERCRPSMFVEVENGNIDLFMRLVAQMRYRIADSYRRYAEEINFLIVPQ